MRSLAEDKGKPYDRPPRFSLRLIEYFGVVSEYRELLERASAPTAPARALMLLCVSTFTLSALMIYLAWTILAAQQ